MSQMRSTPFSLYFCQKETCLAEFVMPGKKITTQPSTKGNKNNIVKTQNRSFRNLMWVFICTQALLPLWGISITVRFHSKSSNRWLLGIGWSGSSDPVDGSIQLSSEEWTTHDKPHVKRSQRLMPFTSRWFNLCHVETCHCICISPCWHHLFKFKNSIIVSTLILTLRKQ